MSFKNKLFERLKGEEYFLEHVCPDDYRKVRGGRSDYFAAYGFDVPMSYSNYYSRLNGIASDRYMSTELYYLFVLPSLNRMNFASAYTDKNMFSVLFARFRQPDTVVKNMNGVFHDGRSVISKSAAIEKCLSEDGACIVKPTIDSSEGKGVELADFTSADLVEATFEKYGRDFIVQRKVCQHREMARFNPTSLNTMRIYSYRTMAGDIHLERAFIRFGGEGSIKDNVSAGGGLVSLDCDGRASNRIFRFKSIDVGSLSKEKGISDFVVPGFDRVRKFVMSLHSTMPYFDYIGWDIGLCEDGKPIFVEYNVMPFLEGPQMACGPMFGDFLDEVMDRVKNVKREERKYWVNIFRPGFENYTLMNSVLIKQPAVCRGAL